MSPRAPKACATEGCEARVIARTYCDDHKPVNWGKGSSIRTGSVAHKVWRRAVLERDHWRCQIRGPKCLGKATQADHIVNVKRGGAEYDLTNGQAVCAPCHQAKTQREALAGKRGG